MDSSSTTFKKSNTPVSDKVSSATDRQLQKGLEAIQKGDEYRDRGDFDKAKAKYEAARKLYPSEAHARLVILPLCKTSMESSDPDRVVSVGIRARLHNMKERAKQVGKRPDPTPLQQQSFFPRPSLSTQSTVASLAISNSQSTLTSLSTCMTATTSTSQSTMATPSTLSSETGVSDVDTISDVHSLTAIYRTGDDGARGNIKQKIYDIINEFGPSGVTFDTVQELVVLADVRDRDIFLHIVTKFLHVLRDSSLLCDIALQGLAVILDSFPDDIDLSSAQGAFVEILKPLQECLRGIRTVNNDLQVVPLLSALNALLDAMVRGKVFGLDREAVYNGLRTSLDDLTSHSNVMVCFQALYAKQALAIIGNNESLPMSIFRRGKLAFALAGDISNMATKLDLTSVESAYKNIKEFFDVSIRDGWYQGLIYADYLIAVAHVEVRNEAVAFLTALGENHIPLVPEMVQSTLQRLQSPESSTGTIKDDVAALKANQGGLRPVWDPAWLAAPKGILFTAVQEKEGRHATLNKLSSQVGAILLAVQSQNPKIAGPSLEDVQSALKTYYKRDLSILRVSGDKLPLETCFVNLAIVEAPAQREKDKQDLKEQAAVFHRIPSSETVQQVNMQKPIPLENLFDKRKLRDGKEDIPKTVLVQGRASVGKTTLCKKLVHAHQTGLWKDRFDTVLWLPLRQIKAFKSRTLETLFQEKFFTQGLDQEGVALAHELAVSAQQGRVLFVLDGLDEIPKETKSEDDSSLRRFLEMLLQQQHVVITSRPSGLDRSLLPPTIDLELETIGFNQQNVNDFVSKVLSPKAAETVQSFIRRTPLIQGLVNIPVQLDVICYSWDSLPTEGLEITMTELYQLMVRKLWCKDALRLKKSTDGEILTQDQISQMDSQEIDDLMATEMQHLGYLAFKGLMSDHQIEFDEKAILDAFRDLKKYCSSRTAAPQLLDRMKQTSFLHTADADLDTTKGGTQQAWNILRQHG
ncbi:hypothetical protein BGZ68_008342 [Mortierella alpina]|nr:hypothetical protein BGZ68_008342 [Mortierella alpina]